MKFEQWFEDEPRGASEKKKLTRILVYPNITWAKDLEQDSYVQVVGRMIRELNKLRDDLWFYMLLPTRVASLALDNVTQIKYNLPTYPNQMRCHFDTIQLLELLSQSYEFDLVFSHLPEHALQLSNLLNNKTHFHGVPIIGYCHWFETKEVTKYSKTVLPINLLGVLEMETCFLNTYAQLDIVLKEADYWFADGRLNELSRKLEVFHLGVDASDIEDVPDLHTEKLIVFNHRPQAYKGFPMFLEICDKLWEKRQDFRVWVPLLEKPIRPYMDTTKTPGVQYYRKLRKCRVGVSCPQEHAGWSISTTDGLMTGVPFILAEEHYYTELWQQADFFKTIDSACKLLESYLDDNEYRNEKAREALLYCRNWLLYSKSIEKLNYAIDDAVSKTRKVSPDAEGYKKIFELIKSRGSASKDSIMTYLGWGPSFDWTPYRRRLLASNHITESVSPWPIYYYG